MALRADNHWRILLAMSLLATSISGCAGLPRIDPSGQRILLFPGEQPPVPTLPPAAAPPVVQPGPAVVVPNPVAPPAATDSYLPGTPGSTVTTDALGRPVVVGPAVGTAPVAVPGVAATPVAVAYGDRLEITPSRVLAPVGSEVVIKAGICNDDGYLLANQKIEWMLGREGVGQIVTVGDRGKQDIGRFPWNYPRKIDSNFAIGYTSPYAECLDRGTPDPNDDVEIRRGDAWMTVTSAAEGTSYVTAYAPDVENWQQRTAAATIYWIDAQWVFPPSTTVAAGQSHALTTTITRQSDGAPIAGWIVRYRVEGGSAGLGYEAGQTSEVVTNNHGRATVEITPTDAQPGTANIAVEILRPEQAGAGGSPRVTLGAGLTSITWATAGGVTTPLVTGPPIVTTPLPGTTTQPPVTTSPSDTAPPATGTPDLDVKIEQVTPGPLQVGGKVAFRVTITNRGSAIARNVTFSDSFSTGLSHPGAAPGVYIINSQSDIPIDILPGDSFEFPLEFDIVAPGQQSHTVNVSAPGATPDSETAYFNVEAGGVAPGGTVVPPSLAVDVLGPPQHNVGERATYRIVVENRGNVPASNIVVASDRDPELRPVSADETFDANIFASTGRLVWGLGELAPGDRTTFTIECDCISPAASACTRVEVSAAGLAAPLRKQACTTIRQALPGHVPGGTGGVSPPGNPPANNNDQGLSVDITSTVAQPAVQRQFVISVVITNNSTQPRRNFQMRMLITPHLQPNVSMINSGLSMQPETRRAEGLELVFGPLAEIPPGKTESIAIPVTALQPGVATIYVERIADGVAPFLVTERIEVLPR
jgi:hypothetical protein